MGKGSLEKEGGKCNRRERKKKKERRRKEKNEFERSESNWTRSRRKSNSIN